MTRLDGTAGVISITNSFFHVLFSHVIQIPENFPAILVIFGATIFVRLNSTLSQKRMYYTLFCSLLAYGARSQKVAHDWQPKHLTFRLKT